MSCSIYKISNKINDKVYIGQTWQALNQRFNEHVSKTNKCHKFRNAIDKYGKDNFKIELIVSCENQESANALEVFWIKCYDSIKTGYNIKDGGSHGKHSAESKAKISAKLIGRKLSAKAILAIAKGHVGNIPTPETRQKLSDARKEFWRKKKVG